jgi:hypothetical protein
MNNILARNHSNKNFNPFNKSTINLTRSMSKFRKEKSKAKIKPENLKSGVNSSCLLVGISYSPRDVKGSIPKYNNKEDSFLITFAKTEKQEKQDKKPSLQTSISMYRNSIRDFRSKVKKINETRLPMIISNNSRNLKNSLSVTRLNYGGSHVN